MSSYGFAAWSTCLLTATTLTLAAQDQASPDDDEMAKRLEFMKESTKGYEIDPLEPRVRLVRRFQRSVLQRHRRIPPRAARGTVA